MLQRLPVVVLASLVATVWGAGAASAQHHMSGTLTSALEVLEAFQGLTAKSIPPALLRDAQGVAIIPRVIKGGFVIGGRFGHGLVLARMPDGAWGNPVFVTLAGGSIGWQAGVQSTDLILVFKTRQSLERILQGKGKVTLGADVAVAAGPLGRQAEAGTDAVLGAEIYSYSRSRGLFAGLSLEGAALSYDSETNRAFVQYARAEDVATVERLKAQLALMSQPPAPVLGVPQPLAPGAQPVPPVSPAPLAVPPGQIDPRWVPPAAPPQTPPPSPLPPQRRN